MMVWRLPPVAMLSQTSQVLLVGPPGSVGPCVCHAFSRAVASLYPDGRYAR